MNLHQFCATLMMLLGVKRSTNAQCLSRETDQMPLYFKVLLFSLCCSLLEQPIDKQYHLNEQDQ